jgi:acyl-CoA synthetase (NDP forming)
MTVPELDYVFHPRTIAIAGVSDENAPPNSGRNFLNVIMDAGFAGKLYPFNRNGGRVRGLKIYSSLAEIPDAIDYVISAVPAQHAPQLMQECVAKRVKLVHFFTAGFSELGDENGKKLENEVAAIAREGGVRITGPNGMGLHCPKSGLSFSPGMPNHDGPFSLLSQSGSHTSYLVREAGFRGLFTGKAISYGNAADLNETDFLDYFAADPETGIIAAYIEGVKDGPRFARTISRAAATKPVIVLKGGTSPAGARSAASHTGSLAGSGRVWDGLMRQAGAIQVQSPDELVDTALFFRFSRPVSGRNVAIVGFGGGVGVFSADLCANRGLNLPRLPEAVKQELRTVWPRDAGSSLNNPVDLFGGAGKGGIEKTLQVIADWPGTDFMLVHIPLYLNPAASEQLTEAYAGSLINLGEKVNRKTAVVISYVFSDQANRIVAKSQAALVQAGFPVFFSMERAINALAKFVDYHEKAATR